MSATLRLTTAQALVRYLAALRVETVDGVVPMFGGVFAIAMVINLASHLAIFAKSRRASS